MFNFNIKTRLDVAFWLREGEWVVESWNWFKGDFETKKKIVFYSIVYFLIYAQAGFCLLSFIKEMQ